MVLDNVAGNEAKRNEGAPQYSSMEGRNHLWEPTDWLCKNNDNLRSTLGANRLYTDLGL